jgi:hypothetical protein
MQARLILRDLLARFGGKRAYDLKQWRKSAPKVG